MLVQQVYKQVQEQSSATKTDDISSPVRTIGAATTGQPARRRENEPDEIATLTFSPDTHQPQTVASLAGSFTRNYVSVSEEEYVEIPEDLY